MHRRLLSLVWLAALLFCAPALSAQVFTPTYLSPQVRNDIGIYLSDGPGDFAFEGIWRGGPFGLRLGYVDATSSLLSLGGAYFRPVQVEDEALDLLLTGGAQALIGDGGGAGVQAGVSAGYTFYPEGIPVTPYLHPRLALLSPLDEVDGSEVSVEVLAEIGAEALIAEQWVARLSVEFTDVGANFGLGVAVRPPAGGLGGR